MTVHLVVVLLLFGIDVVEEALLRSEDGDFTETSPDSLPCITDVLLLGGVFADDPENTPIDLASSNLTKSTGQPGEDGRPQVGELLDYLLDEADNINSRGIVEVGNEVHKKIDNAGCDLGELDGTLMYGMDEELAILRVLLVLLVHSLGKLLLEEQDNFFHVLARDHFQSKCQCFSADIDIGARKGSENIHNKIIEDAFVLPPQLVHPVEDDQLNIIIGLLDAKLNKLGGGSLDGNGVVCKRR